MFYTGIEWGGTGRHRFVLTHGTQFTLCVCIHAQGYLIAFPLLLSYFNHGMNGIRCWFQWRWFLLIRLVDQLQVNPVLSYIFLALTHNPILCTSSYSLILNPISVCIVTTQRFFFFRSLFLLSLLRSGIHTVCYLKMCVIMCPTPQTPIERLLSSLFLKCRRFNVVL